MKSKFKMAIQGCINGYKGEYGKVLPIYEKVHEFKKGHVQGHVGISGNNIYIGFPGSIEKKDWKDNFKIWLKKIKASKKLHLHDNIRVHTGFKEQTDTIKKIVSDLVEQAIENKEVDNDFKLIVYGHSLGGAIATLISWHFARIYPVHDIICITFGSPRVGNKAFADQFNKEVPHSYRFVYGMDSVCGVPQVFFGYWHVENMIRLKMPWYDVVLMPVVFFTGMPLDHYPQLYKKAVDKKY